MPAAEPGSMDGAPYPAARRENRNPWPAVVLIAGLVLALDQLTKWLIVEYLAGEGDQPRIDVVGSWLALAYVENRGAAFGILQGYSDLLLVVAVVVVVGIAIMFQRMAGASRLLPLATGLIIGGAAGNIVDRVRLGFVVDFVAVGPFPRFNVADAAISVGVLLMVGAVLFDSGQPDPAGAESTVGRVSER